MSRNCGSRNGTQNGPLGEAEIGENPLNSLRFCISGSPKGVHFLHQNGREAPVLAENQYTGAKRRILAGNVYMPNHTDGGGGHGGHAKFWKAM